MHAAPPRHPQCHYPDEDPMAMRVKHGVKPIKRPPGTTRDGSRPQPPKAVALRASLEATRAVPDHQKSERRLTDKTVASPPAAQRCALTWVESIICVWADRPIEQSDCRWWSADHTRTAGRASGTRSSGHAEYRWSRADRPPAPCHERRSAGVARYAPTAGQTAKQAHPHPKPSHSEGIESTDHCSVCNFIGFWP